MTDAVYEDEQGNRVDPSQVGNTHEIIGEGNSLSSQTPSNTPSSSSPYNQLIQEERVSNFISQTSPVQSLNNINYMLRGYIYSNEDKQWNKVSDGIPDKIRLDFIQFITPTLSEDVRMTNLAIEQINGIMEFTIEWVVDYLDSVADEYKLQEEQMTKITLILCSAVFYTLLRSQNGVERTQMFKSLTLGETLNPVPQQRSENMSWWKFWK